MIRSSPGYDEALVGLSKHDKEYLRGDTSSYTVSNARAERATRVLDHKKFKAALAAGEVKPSIRNGYGLSSLAQENRFKPKDKKKDFY